jgi:hypothetical protein
MITSRSALNNGKACGSSVWYVQGTTLKGIRTATPNVSLFFLALDQILFNKAIYTVAEA